jgi:hypothetical protein
MYITQQATTKRDKAKFQYPFAPACHGYKKRARIKKHNTSGD